MTNQLQPEQDPKLLLITVDEAAQRLSIGRSHLYLQMQSGMLRSIQIGRSRRILERDLEDFIERLMDGSGGLPVGAEQLLTRGPVKRLPTRAGRR